MDFWDWFFTALLCGFGGLLFLGALSDAYENAFRHKKPTMPFPIFAILMISLFGFLWWLFA
jgi:hypothetical protein